MLGPDLPNTQVFAYGGAMIFPEMVTVETETY